MLSPSHPLRYFISYNGRKLIRSVQDTVQSSRFCKQTKTDLLAELIRHEESPIFRNFSGVRKALFVNKITNLNLALNHINGIVIEPGKTFSFWNLVGKPSAEKGYLPGLVIERGEAREGVGGGLCQLANMIHWLALHSELDVIERHRHSFDIFPDDDRTVPFGTGATVVYNYKDLRLINNTPHTYQYVFNITDNILKGELRASEKQKTSTYIEERDHAFIKTEQGLFRKNTIYQHRMNEGDSHKTETLVFHNYCRCQYSLDEVSL